MNQKLILDPDGYELHADQYAFLFSQPCRISLKFTESQTRGIGITKGIGDAVSDTMSGIAQGTIEVGKKIGQGTGAVTTKGIGWISGLFGGGGRRTD